MTVLSNGGSNGNTYSITIPMGNSFKAGTEFTDIIGCGKVKVASTGDFVTSIVKGMPQVIFPLFKYPHIPYTPCIPYVSYIPYIPYTPYISYIPYMLYPFLYPFPLNIYSLKLVIIVPL